jgi:phenylpropionate dioxygenase-like ring-hydroxylating dioxygenase large terminal subunit
MGELMRRYWLPVLLSEEVAENDGPPVRVRLLGENLIAFRDTQGRVGLVDAYCPHRRAPMFYGRNEECGLRCIYHGWKFDVDGRCMEIPSLPPDGQGLDRIRMTAYPTYEKSGVVFAYMGPAELKPPYPDYEWMRAPATHRHVTKNYQASNYLQALEGGLDTSHSTFLHNNRMGNRNTMRNCDPAPQIDVYPTNYGYSYVSTRKLSEEDRYIRIYHYVMPFQQMRGDVTDDFGQRSKVPKIDGHFWVPIDDHQTIVWNWMYGIDHEAEITPEFAERDEKRAGRGKDDFIPGTFKLKRNPSNDHLIDRNLQKATTYTGIAGVGTQDMAVQEGMEPIVDRTKENLVWTDKAVIIMRRMMLEATHAVERGEQPPGVDPATHSKIRPWDTVIKANVDWREALNKEITATW